MHECQQLQRTVLQDIDSFCEDGTIKDVMNLVRQTKDYGNEILDAHRHQVGSIAKRASQLVMAFPVLISSSIKVETAVLVAKAIEKKQVSMLQLLFNARDVTQYRDTKDLYDYIKKFHTNIDQKGSNISLDDFITAVDTITAHKEDTEIPPEIMQRIMQEMKELNIPAKDSLRESSVNDYAVTNTMYGNTMVTLEAGGGNNGGNGKKKSNNNNGALRPLSPKDQADIIKNQIIPTAVDKANELVPTMMMVNYITMIDGTPVQRTGVIGVKAKMYPIDSMEIIGRVSSKYTDGNTFFNLIRCSTKEKSFFKDLAFAFEKTKWDAVNIAKGSVNTQLFRMLERRASKFRSLFGNKRDASPITTLVISQEEVEYLKKYSNMNMENYSTARKILDGYNLMGIVIVNDSIEIAKFLFDDGATMYETMTFDALAKENSNGDYKKIVNLMARMNR